MNKTILTLALAALTFGAQAWEIALTTNATPTMIVPPAVDYSVLNSQIPVRSATNVVVAGAVRREGLEFIVAANAGTMGTNITTRTYTIGGVSVAASVAATSVVAVVTNTVTRIAPLTVPDTGLSAADGSVYWFRVPRVSEWPAVIMQPYITSSGTVYYSTPAGDGLTEATSKARTELRGNTQAIYGRANITNCTVSVLPIR